jgi:acyl-CoA hydrolase
MSRTAGKKVAFSQMTTVRLMMPTDGNVLGNVFGGSIMRYMDEVAGIVAFHHARKLVVTASIDRMDFFAPVYVGNLLILKAAVNYVGRTSMEVGVRIEAEDPLTAKTTHTCSCYLTFVAIDGMGKPSAVDPVIPVTREEKRRYAEAQSRRKQRDAALARKKKLR